MIQDPLLRLLVFLLAFLAAVYAVVLVGRAPSKPGPPVPRKPASRWPPTRSKDRLDV